MLDVATCTKRASLAPAGTATKRALAFSSPGSGSVLAAADDFGSISLWDVEQQLCTLELQQRHKVTPAARLQGAGACLQDGRW